MKRISNIINLNKAAHLATLSLLWLLSGCSSDDGPTISITAGQQVVTINGINDCNTSLGDGTTLLIDIPYTTSMSLNITQLRITTTVEDGTSQEGINTTIVVTTDNIRWATCFTFGTQAWVEYEVRLESDTGILSNPTTVRVDRPAGAN